MAVAALFFIFIQRLNLTDKYAFVYPEHLDKLVNDLILFFVFTVRNKPKNAGEVVRLDSIKKYLRFCGWKLEHKFCKKKLPEKKQHELRECR